MTTISANIENGKYSTNMIRASLKEVLIEAIHKAPENKADCWLISNGFSTQRNKYTREEWNFDAIETILIDCDNNKDNPDPTLLEQFKNDFNKYEYILWETASSTIECPKFRAILLLDERIEWINEPVKYTKLAIQELFAKWQDNAASWFFTPTKGKIATFTYHKGEKYPSRNIIQLVNMRKAVDEAMKPSSAFDLLHTIEDKPKVNENGWRFLPSVKHCLEGLKDGEKDNSLRNACYAMDRNGYRQFIPQFLDECTTVVKSHRDKWLKRYS